MRAHSTTRAAGVPRPTRRMAAIATEHVTHVHHWNDSLFTFRTTRDPGFRFENGHFVMVGLPVDGKPLLRAYSIASPNWEEHLEFFSIKVPNGPLTSRLQHIREGDPVLVSRKPTGTLVLHDLKPGRNLYLLGTGTGLAPFLSIIQDPETYERYEKVILVHGCREVAELAYQDLFKSLPNHEFLGEIIGDKLIYCPTVTREPFERQGRITDLIEDGRLWNDFGLPALNPAEDRVMICGSPAMLRDLKKMLEERGFAEGNTTKPGDFVIERAFAEQ